MYKEKFPVTHKKVTSTINIGDDYTKKKVKPSRIIGKQFVSSPGVENFSTPEFKSDPVVGIIKYSVVQPLEGRKLGFGSHMATVTDEFSSTIRTQQWREVLKSESIVEQDRLKAMEKKEQERRTRFPKLNTKEANRVTMYIGGRPMSDKTYDRLPKLFQRNVPTSLYDIGKEEFNGLTPTCNKCHRDKFYCKHRANAQPNEDMFDTGNINLADGAKLTPRYTGPFFVSSEVYGNFGSEQVAARPDHGRRNLTKEFFDTVKGGSLVK